jgi:hypothetical protein
MKIDNQVTESQGYSEDGDVVFTVEAFDAESAVVKIEWCVSKDEWGDVSKAVQVALNSMFNWEQKEVQQDSSIQAIPSIGTVCAFSDTPIKDNAEIDTDYVIGEFAGYNPGDYPFRKKDNETDWKYVRPLSELNQQQRVSQEKEAPTADKQKEPAIGQICVFFDEDTLVEAVVDQSYYVSYYGGLTGDNDLPYQGSDGSTWKNAVPYGTQD